MSVSKLQDKPGLLDQSKLNSPWMRSEKFLSGLMVGSSLFHRPTFFSKGWWNHLLSGNIRAGIAGFAQLQRLTPTMISRECVFMVGNQWFWIKPTKLLTYRVSIIFSVNLELIDKPKLDQDCSHKNWSGMFVVYWRKQWRITNLTIK
jgi:hypothetical protein